MDSSSKFKAIVAQVKLEYNIVDYIQQSGVQLKQQGFKWKGLCPFHNEKTPSFTVDENFQNFRCFGCGAHGDIFAFISKSEHLDFFEALRKLAEEKGIEIELDKSTNDVDYKSLRACIKDVANYFYVEFKKLPDAHPAKQEIISRGLDMTKFLYGYAPEGRQTLYNLLKGKGYSDETIKHTGACGVSEKGVFYDLWQGRLMFFVTDITGKPIGFSGRKLYETDRMGKYVNSPEGPLFNKSASLFNINKAKAPANDAQAVYVAEGQFDVISMFESGMENVVASLGTAFTEEQGNLCKRLATAQGRIVFCYDGDAAGIAAAQKVFRNVPAIHDQAYVVPFPEGQDPCDYKMKHGADGLKAYVEQNQKPLVEFVLSVATKSYDMNSPLGRTSYVNEAAQVLKTVSNLPLRQQFIRQVALHSLNTVDIVTEAVNAASPLRKNSNAGFEEKQEAPRPVELIEGDEDAVEAQKRIIEQIRSDKMFAASARLIALNFMEPRFLTSTLKAKQYMVAPLRSIVDEMEQFSGSDKPVVAELFTMSTVVEAILSMNLFPFAQLMSVDALKEQFTYIRDYLRSNSEQANRAAIQDSIAKILESSPNAPVEFLERAMAKEKQQFDNLSGTV